MKFECDSCHAQYMIADEKLGTRGVKVKCKRCSHVIIVRPPKGDEGEPVDEEAPTTATPAPGFLEGEAKATMPDGAGDELGDFDSEEESTRATGLEANTEVVAAMAGDDTMAGDPPAPPPVGPDDNTVVGPTPGLGLDDEAGDEDDNPFLQSSAAADADSPFRGLGELDEDDDDEGTQADLSPPPALGGANEADSENDPGLRMDSELEANPFFDESAPEASDEPEPPAPSLDLGTDVPAPPPPEAVPEAPADADVGAMPALGDGDDLLEGELAGAFGAMFADPSEGGQDRGPTQVLDLGRVDELRAASLRSEAQGDGLDDLRSGLDASLDAPFAGLSPFASGMHEAGHTAEGAPETSQASADEDDGEWHAAIDDEDVGPLTLRDIGEHIQKGSVDRETLVWRPGMDDWTPAGEVREVRPLFDAVPRPRISSEGIAPFDVGAPIDDRGSAPFQGGESPAEPPDPFGAIPGFDTDDSGGAWQPHGLTEVYQAANLAEAAGGLGAPPPPSPGASGALDDDEEVDWKPGAGSALASLVSSEIERLESPSFGEGSLPPAADDSLSLDLDSTPLGGLSSDGLGALGSLDVPEDQGQPAAAPPAFAAASPELPPAASGIMAPAVTAPGMPMVGYPAAPPSPLKNPIVLIAAVGGTVIALLLVMVLVLVFREPAPVIAQQPMPGAAVAMAPGQPVPAGAGTAAPAATAPAPGAAAAAAVAPEGAATETPPATEEPAAPEAPSATEAPATAEGAAAEEPPAGGDAAATAAAAAASTAEKAPAPAAAKPPAPKREEKAPTRVAAAQKKQPERQVQRRQQRRQQPKQRPQPSRRASRDCDPVLDLDCDERPSRGSSSRATQKAELTRNDVLGVIRSNLRTVNSCATQHRAKGTLQMEWRVLRSGATSSVRVVSPNFVGTPVGTCVTNAIKRWKFPASQKPPSEAIKFPFKLNG